MFVNSRVTEYEGAEHLATAGKEVLNNPSLDMAIVHGVDFPHASVFDLPREELLEILDNVDSYIPQLQELDQEVSDWWESCGAGPRVQLRPHLRGNAVVTGSALHTDSHLTGPLSISLRIDRSRQSRIFYAKRSNDSILDSDGNLSFAFALQRERKANSLRSRALKLGVSAVKQCRGDAIFFANSPYPTVHGVRTRDFKTEALTMHYGLVEIP